MEQDTEIRAGTIPCSFDIEKSVLQILINNPILYINCNHVELDFFYLPKHRDIFNKFIELVDTGTVFDINILSHKLGISLEKYITTIDNSALLNEYIEILDSLNAKRKILSLSQTLSIQIENSTDTDLVISNAIDELTLLLSKKKSKDISSFIDTHSSAIDDIDDAYSGKGAVLSTGWETFDRIGALPRKNNIIVFAADKASAKTNFIIALEKKLLDRNKAISVLHITMEEPKEKILRRMVSSKTGLSERQLLCVNYQHTQEDHDNIVMAFKYLQDKNYDLTFIEKKLSMIELKMYVRKFNNACLEKGTDAVIIVDNLGLIDDDRFKEDVARENNIAGEFVRLRDQTKASFAIIHHLNKSQSNKFQIVDGYRPREEHVRGSSRIIDYANQVALINLPKKYPDLLELYKRRCFVFPEDLDKYSLEDILDMLWVINPNVSSSSIDFNASKIIDLKSATLNQLRSTCLNKICKDGNKMSPSYIYKKYVQYVNAHIAKEETKFESQRKDPVSIYTFLEKGWVDKDYQIAKTPRDIYLFGSHYDSSDVNMKILEELFIVEFTKNRNNDGSSDDNLIRFKANLNANIFQELSY